MKSARLKAGVLTFDIEIKSHLLSQREFHKNRIHAEKEIGD